MSSALPPNPADANPRTLASRAIGRASKMAGRATKRTQEVADTALGTTQAGAGALQEKASSLPGPLGTALGAVPLEKTVGYARSASNTTFSAVRGGFGAVRVWLASMWMRRWVRLVAITAPAALAGLWFGAQTWSRARRRRTRVWSRVTRRRARRRWSWS